MTWSAIHLELARSTEHPNGSPAYGYDLVAPLTADGVLDETAWREGKKHARVRRFSANQSDEVGALIHTRHRTWAFSYEPGEDDDEPVFKLQTHVVRPGEYLSITEHDGETRTFRIISIRPLTID